MKRIPPEIDDLLWAVAEGGNDQAHEEFVRRYPQYAGELARRRTMVTGLKGRRPSARKPARGTYRPAPVPKTTSGPVWAIPSLVAACVVALAFLGWSVTRPVAKVVVRPPAPIINNPPPVEPTPNVVPNPDPSPSVPPEPDPAPATGIANSADRPRAFRVRGAGLPEALAILAAESGVKVVIGPGMPKTIVDVDYEGMSFNEIIRELGRKYGFTPFDQGDGSFILVPAVDSRRVPMVSGNGEIETSTTQSNG